MAYRPGPGVGDGQATDSTVYAVCLVLSEVKHDISKAFLDYCNSTLPCWSWSLVYASILVCAVVFFLQESNSDETGSKDTLRAVCGSGHGRGRGRGRGRGHGWGRGGGKGWVVTVRKTGRLITNDQERIVGLQQQRQEQLEVCNQKFHFNYTTFMNLDIML